MPLSHTAGPRARREFVVTPYIADASGRLQPERPDCCPWKAPREDLCPLFDHHWRERKTGPCFPLVVLGCRAHERAFTLYPPGHVPYGRVALSPVAPDGSSIRASGKEPVERFRGTLFEPALDAARGRAWHREHVGSTERWWGTQLRRLARAAELVAVASNIPNKLREQLAEALALGGLVVREQAERFRQAAGYRQRGQVVVRVLAALPTGRFLSERLSECGYLVGHWGAPHRWLPETRTLRRQVFRGAGTHAARRPP